LGLVPPAPVPFGSFGAVKNDLKTNEEVKNDLEKL
jgi:hypothetical protein